MSVIEEFNMKVIGYGWIKAGETLSAAMDRYGVPKEIKSGEQVIKAEKALFKTPNAARKDFKNKVEKKEHRKSAKPRYFRVVLQEME
jgi:hypothetical protein